MVDNRESILFFCVLITVRFLTDILSSFVNILHFPDNSFYILTILFNHEVPRGRPEVLRRDKNDE